MISAFVESKSYMGPVLIYELMMSPIEGLIAVCANDEGRGMLARLEDLRFDVRYDWNGHQWVDVNGVTEDAEEEPAPDGGEEVP